jgi:hypothetical protein
MSDLLQYLTDHRSELVELHPDPTFHRELDSLINSLAGEEDERVRSAEIWRVVGKYPPVISDLSRHGFAPQTPDGPATVPPTTAYPARPQPEPPRQSQPPGRAASWPGREIVSAVLAVAIVVTTLAILVISLFRTDEAGRAVSKDALVFANGLLGVVLGYYFGRLPGETIAANARADADRANTALDQMVGEVRSVLNAGTTAQRGTGGALAPDQADRLRDLVARYASRR